MAEEKKLTGFPSIDKPWLKFYAEEKRSFRIPDCSVFDYMLKNNEDNLDATALAYFGAETSYRELIEKINRCVKSFITLGVKKGDIVSFCNPTTPEVYYAFYALNKIGAVANMIDPRTNASRIEEFIENTHSNIVFYIDIAYPKIKGILANDKIKKAICISPADSLKPAMKIAYKLANHIPASKRAPKSDKYISWNQFFALGINKIIDLPVERGKCNLPAGIIYTSGTTGIPKGAVISNKNLIAMVQQNICADMGWEKNDRFLGIMPPFIAYGLVCGFTLPLCLGMRVTIIPKFEVEKFDSYILKHKPHHLMGVPAYIEKLMVSPKMKKSNLCFLKTVIVGGDKLNPETEIAVNDFLKAHNSSCRVVKGYGMTEMSSNAVFPRNEHSNKIGSVGTPLVENNIKVIDTETGIELGYNTVGEICLTGPTLIDGYWNNESENQSVFRIEDGIRWIHTGDRGYIDSDGVVFFNDRLKRIIVRSDGHNVWPSDSEKIIEKHPCVDSCCVVGIKDIKSGQGEIAVAFFIMKKGCTKSSQTIIEELKTMLLDSLPSRDVPQLFYVKDEFPLSPVGKVDYRALEQEANC